MQTRGLLTQREKDVLTALVRADGDMAVAAEALGISANTAAVHMVKAARSLGTTGEGRLATVLAAYRAGHIDIEPTKGGPSWTTS